MKVFGLPSNSYVKIANSSDFYTLESLFFARLAEISGIRWCEITLHPTMEAWVSGLNHLSAKEALLRGSKVRIFPFPHHARMVKWLTRRSAKPLLAGSSPAPGSHRELAQWLARKSYILTVSGSSPEFPTNQYFYISLHPQN